MKVSRNDPFDLNLSVRGLTILMTYMYSDIYEYMYHLTFKRTMKLYAKEFSDPWERSIDHEEFFQTTEDLFVQNALRVQSKLIDAKLELLKRFGIDEFVELENEETLAEAGRFPTFFLLSKRSKSYKRLKLFYERTLSEHIFTLYLYGCALTATTYKVPLVLKRQFQLQDPASLRLLNQDDDTVELLIVLIRDLMELHKELMVLIENNGKLPKPKAKRRSTV